MSMLHLPLRFALAGALLFSLPALAATNIQPPMATLTADNPSTLLTIGNERGVPAGYEIEALGWEQTATGEVLLPPTTGIRVEPASLDIPPNGTAQVRITALDSPGNAEKVYRVRVRERPGREREQGEEQVQVLAVVTLPVFLVPPRAEVKGRLEAKALTKGKLGFTVVNSGTVHTYVGDVAVSGQGKDGRPVFEIHRRGWYVLADGRLEFTAALSAKDCRASKRIDIVARALQSDDTWHASVEPAPGQCGNGKVTEFPSPDMKRLAPK